LQITIVVLLAAGTQRLDVIDNIRRNDQPFSFTVST